MSCDVCCIPLLIHRDKIRIEGHSYQLTLNQYKWEEIKHKLFLKLWRNEWVVIVHCGTQKQIRICCAIDPWLSYFKVSKLPSKHCSQPQFRKGDHKSTQNKLNYDLCSVYTGLLRAFWNMFHNNIMSYQHT